MGVHGTLIIHRGVNILGVSLHVIAGAIFDNGFSGSTVDSQNHCKVADPIFNIPIWVTHYPAAQYLVDKYGSPRSFSLQFVFKSIRIYIPLKQFYLWLRFGETPYDEGKRPIHWAADYPANFEHTVKLFSQGGCPKIDFCPIRVHIRVQGA